MRSLLAMIGVACAVTMIRMPEARACGGCFHEAPAPQQKITVVTDHRMAFAVSPTQTTLYDQIRYSGDPSKFAWILPIASTVDVGLSADVMFGALDTLTQTVIYPPIYTCPPPPNCPYYGGGGGSGCSCGSTKSEDFAAVDGGAALYDSSAPRDGVEVTKQEVVGPYETVQLKATDPMGVTQWLTMNGFVIPDDIKPVIAAYQAEGFGFLALKLQPGASVSAMRPVRVTTKGAGLSLPLRMVAAGTGATVGITLWIVAEGRYEPANFPLFQLKNDELVWDWLSQSSNASVLRAKKAADLMGFGWEIESSLDELRSSVEQIVLNGGTARPISASIDYEPVVDAMNNITKTAEQVRQEDLDTLFSGMSTSARITRIRSDLARSALAQDLRLNASADQTILPNVHRLTLDVNRPPCPGTMCAANPKDGARGGGGCATAATKASDFSLIVCASAFALTLLRQRRKRRRL